MVEHCLIVTIAPFASLPPMLPGRRIDVPRFRQLLRSLVPDLPTRSAAALVCVIDHTNWACRTTDDSRAGM